MKHFANFLSFKKISIKKSNFTTHRLTSASDFQNPRCTHAHTQNPKFARRKPDPPILLPCGTRPTHGRFSRPIRDIWKFGEWGNENKTVGPPGITNNRLWEQQDEVLCSTVFSGCGHGAPHVQGLIEFYGHLRVSSSGLHGDGYHVVPQGSCSDSEVLQCQWILPQVIQCSSRVIPKTSGYLRTTGSFKLTSAKKHFLDLCVIAVAITCGDVIWSELWSDASFGNRIAGMRWPGLRSLPRIKSLPVNLHLILSCLWYWS